MKALTKDQFNRWNAKAAGGFEFDPQAYIMRGDKELRKEIPHEDGTKTVYTIRQREHTSYFKSTFEIIVSKDIHRPAGHDGMFYFTREDTLTTGIFTPRRDYNAICKYSAMFCEF